MPQGKIGSMTRKTIAVFAFMSVALCLSGCATWWGDKSDREPAVTVYREDESGIPATEAEYRSRLETLVRRSVAQTESETAERQQKLLYKRPYYYRQYEEYPNGADGMEVAFRETQSKTAPYVADVKLEKVRFGTRLHRRKEEAQSDTNFLRDTGEEIQTYEFRNGRWNRVGSIFLADQSEELVNGEWVPLQEEVQRTVAAEEEQADSWWRRALGRVTGK